MNSKDRDGPSPQTAFIQIPHIHPGRDKYGGQPESLRRTFLFTWMATLVINCYMMEAIDELGKTDELSCREELCRIVINRFEKEAAPLIKEFEKVKNQLSKDWENLNERRIILSLETRSAVSKQHAQVRKPLTLANFF